MGALLGAGKRLITGESLFMTVFTNQGSGKEQVAFAAPYAGKILAIDLKQVGGELIAQKDAFLCAARGVSFSHVLTSGNSCDVDMADYVAYLADEPACRAIACVFEGMAQPRRLLDAARIAWQADKPLIVFKMANSEHGAAAALSHTGSLAGSHEAYRAWFRREGVTLVEHYEALLETAAFFAKAPPPKAQGVAILATSGGAGIMAADRAEQYGIPLPEPEPKTRAILEQHIPEFGSARNPCDVTAQVINDPVSLSACATAFLEQSDYGAIVAPQVYAYAPAVSRIALYDEMAARAGKPICTVLLTEDVAGPGARETELASHVTLFRSMDNCFATLAAWQRRAAMREAPAERAARVSPEAAREDAAKLIRATWSPAMTEREAKAVLALYGVPVVGEQLAATADEAVAAAERFGFPVVLKADSPDLLHKTEAGVIRLNLRSVPDVLEAHAAIMEGAAALSPPPRINGVLVQPMIPPGVEVMAGARIDPLFGPLVVVGLGGILIELIKDTALAPAPVGPGEALDMLRSLKGFHLLQGFRNFEPVNLDALADVVCRVSELAADQSALVSEIDVNPIICAGDRITAVDALIVCGDSRA